MDKETRGLLEAVLTEQTILGGYLTGLFKTKNEAVIAAIREHLARYPA